MCADVADCSQNSNWETYTNRTSGSANNITNLTAGTAYRVQVQAAKTSSGNTVTSAWSSSSAAQSTSGTQPTVAVPTMSAPVGGNAQVTITWTAVADANGGYQVQHCASGANCGANGVGSDWSSATPTDVSGQATQTTTISGLTNGTTYRFRIRAVRTFTTPPFSISSGWSNTQDGTPVNVVVPATPSGLAVAASSSQVALDVSWTAGTTTGNAVPTGYTVQYCLNSSCTWTTFTPGTALTGTSTSVTITGLTAGTAYKVRIQATNSAGNSPWAEYGSAVTTPTGVVGFGVSAFAPKEMQVSWSALSSASSGYYVQYKASSSSSWETAVAKNASDTSHEFKGLANNTAYDFRIQGRTSSTETTGWTTVTNKTTTNGGLSTPTPSNLDRTDNGNNDFDFSISVTNVTGATRFQTQACATVGTDCTFNRGGTFLNNSSNRTGVDVSSVQLSANTPVVFKIAVRARKGGSSNSLDCSVSNPCYHSAWSSAVSRQW